MILLKTLPQASGLVARRQADDLKVAIKQVTHLLINILVTISCSFKDF